jgi:hypothetical protein
MIEKLAYQTPGGYNLRPVSGMPSEGYSTLQTILTWSITMLMIVATLVFIVLLVWGGIQWITSGGEKAGIESARKRIVFAIAGLVVIFLSFAIIRLVGQFFDLKLLKI